MKIGKFKLNNPIVLAPMAGYTNASFRHLCTKFGADFCITEMVSAKALTLNSQKTIALLKTASNEKIKIVQLFGSDPKVFALAVKHPALKKFDIININMGCPANKIIKNNEGSSLMKNLPLAKEIISSCVANTTKPVTVKFRLGFKTNNAVEFAKMCQSAGASAVFVHGRLSCDGYSGEADYGAIKQVKDALNIPVFANGDVNSKQKLNQILKQTGADGVMIGRATIGKPWLFKELKKENFKPPKRQKIIKLHIKLLKKYGELNVNEFKKHLIAYYKGMPNASEIKNKIVAIKTQKDLENLF